MIGFSYFLLDRSSVINDNPQISPTPKRKRNLDEESKAREDFVACKKTRITKRRVLILESLDRFEPSKVARISKGSTAPSRVRASKIELNEHTISSNQEDSKTTYAITFILTDP